MRVNSTDFQNASGKYLSLVKKEDIIIIKMERVLPGPGNKNLY